MYCHLKNKKPLARGWCKGRGYDRVFAVAYAFLM